MGPNDNATLSCEVYRLDVQQIGSYHWKWKFHGGEIEEDGKYKIISMHSPPNSCQQTNGLVTLEIANVSKHDLGHYKCGLQMSDIKLAERDIPFYDFGELYTVPFISCLH